ncbi:MAG TPA: DUF3093 domain-containing protein [Microbacteriaceae bacterium]|nr:DUF3093 domain-containing protein [Microbacteriaceae bacterium]
MTTSDEVVFKEKIWPSLGMYLATLLIIPAMTVLIMPFSRSNGIFIGIALYLLIIATFTFTAPKVVLTKHTLSAGRGHIERQFLGSAVALDRIAYRQEIGRKLDARAFLAMSGWAKTGIKVEVVDPTDPTPYWIISTRKPAELVKALA